MEKKKSASSQPGAPTPDRATTSKSGKKSGRPKTRDEDDTMREEENRLKQEQEEQERKNREFEEAEKLKNKAKKIIELKNRELNTFYDLINQINYRIERHHQDRRENARWIRYTKCDGSPDPVNAGQINTFLSLWKDDDDESTIKTSLININLSLELIEELYFLCADYQAEVDAEILIEKHKHTIRKLEKAIQLKLDNASYHLLLGASEKTDPETLNFDTAVGDEKITHCIWANLSHNPKIKDHAFPSKKLSFVLPRPLTIAKVAFRALFTKFDPYSPRSKTFSCRIKKEKFEFDPIPELIIEREATEMAEEDEPVDDEIPPELKAIMDLESESTEKKEEEKEEEKVAEIPKEPTTLDNIEPKILPEELAILTELSDSFVIDLRNYLPLGEIFNIGLYTIPPQPKKVRNYVITKQDHMGKLVEFEYPAVEQELVANSWNEYWRKKQELDKSANPEGNETMNGTLKSNDFLDSTANETVKSDANSKESNFMKILGKGNEALIKAMKAEGPLTIKYEISPNLFFGEAPQLARWDDEKLHWRTDGILDFKFNEETNEIQFKTYYFSPYCLLQDRHVHMPFQSWRMAPREAINSCMFTVEATNFELNIEIKLDQVRIYIPERPKPTEAELKASRMSAKNNKQVKDSQERPESMKRLDFESTNQSASVKRVLEPIANQWFTLRKFIEVLKSIGLNIFPELDSEKFVTITSKNKKLERLVYRNMALCSCLLSFAFSKWNAEINEESSIVILHQLHTTEKEPNPDLNKCLLCTQDVYVINDSSEMSDEFSPETSEGTEEHADMYHLCLDEISKADKSLIDARIRQIDPLYYQTCLELLESLKFLTFA